MRFWKDIEGQEKRQHVRERICPIVGPGSMNRSERERRAREIIAESKADTAEYFNRVVNGSVSSTTFKEQARPVPNRDDFGDSSNGTPTFRRCCE